MRINRLLIWTAPCLFAAVMFAQGDVTKATKDDWEEINFEFNSSILSDGYPTMLRLADLLKQHSDYRIKVEGHTDFVGSDAYNEKLALARAAAVKNFLVKYGAGSNQIQTSGQGKRIPEVPNASKEGRFINRRVVLTVTDGTGKVIAAGSGPEVVNTLDDRLKKLEDCCSQILKKLDKLDEILAALRDLKGENDRLKQDVAALKAAQARPVETTAKPLTGDQTAQIAREETRKALDEQASKNKKFALLGANVGPTKAGELNFSGKARYFAPFGTHHAVQAEGEYMYYGGKRIEGRQEGQFDLGLVNRWGPIQAGTFASFKYLSLSQYESGGTLGQGAFTLDYVFNRGRFGFFGTKGFKNEAVLNRAQLGPSSFLETYARIVDQAGGSALVGLFGHSYIEGNIGALFRQSGSARPGGMIRFVQPIDKEGHIAFTFEAGLNETLLTANDSGRFAFGLQFGNWMRPKDYGTVKHPVPVDIPRVRYELLTRKVGNSAPVADAGPDQIGVLAGTISLDGSNSYDPDGDPLTYEWRQTSGPTVSIAGQNTAKASFPAAEGQSYTFRLTVRDTGGLQGVARVTVTVRQSPQVRILRFQANPNVIKAGESSTIIWQVENADTVEITGLGRVDARNGSSVVSPTETTIYRLTARNAQGEVNESLTITVQRPDVRILRFLATPATILPGEVSTLAWETENATSVSISGVGPVRPNGTATVSPTQTTTYTLTATGQFGTVNATATVQVTPGQAPRIIRFAAAPVEILPTEQASLVWQVENATDVTISGIGKVEPIGTSTVSPTANTTYTIVAKNQYGEVSATAVVGVIAPVKILDFVADPPTVVIGNSVTLRWSTVNATEVVITGVGTVPSNGTVTVKPTSDVSYTLLAYGNRSQASAFVLVKAVAPAPTNRPPVANAGPDRTVGANYASLDGSRSFDPDGDPITYAWRFVSFSPDPKFKGTGPTTPSISGGTSAAPTVTMPNWGQYVFELVVTDDKGASSSSFVRVTFVDP